MIWLKGVLEAHIIEGEFNKDVPKPSLDALNKLNEIKGILKGKTHSCFDIRTQRYGDTEFV